VFPPPVTTYGPILPHLTVGISTLFAISKFLSFLADGGYLQHIPPHIFYYSSPGSLHFHNRSTHVAPFVLTLRFVFPHTGSKLHLMTGYFHRWPPYMAHFPPPQTVTFPHQAPANRFTSFSPGPVYSINRHILPHKLIVITGAYSPLSLTVNISMTGLLRWPHVSQLIVGILTTICLIQPHSSATDSWCFYTLRHTT
jgi:hypothetical protein